MGPANCSSEHRYVEKLRYGHRVKYPLRSPGVTHVTHHNGCAHIWGTRAVSIQCLSGYQAPRNPGPAFKLADRSRISLR